MKEVAKIIAYLTCVLLLGALLAPVLFWNLGGIQRWALANGWMSWDPHESDVQVSGLMGFLTADLQHCFSVALLLAASILLLPTARIMGITGLKKLRLHPALRGWPHFWRGLAIAILPLGLLGAFYILANIAHPRVPAPWGQLPVIILSAVVIGILEELIFRGFILGALLRHVRPRSALAVTTFVFAGFHFLNPVRPVSVSPVTWRSGFELLAMGFRQFGNPGLLLVAFGPLLICGWLFGFARLRTQALRMSIGLHIGVLLAVSAYGAFAVQTAAFLPWIGENLRTGLAPALALLAALGLAWWRLEHEDLLPNPKPRD